MSRLHVETHVVDRIGWLRASILGANDGIVSTASLIAGASLPLVLVPIFGGPSLAWVVSGASLLFLAIFGVIGAKAGGAPVGKAVLRVTFWGAFVMAATAAIGSLFGTTVG